MKFATNWPVYLRLQLIMPKYLDTLENIYTAMQVSRKLGNSLENLDDFWLKYHLPDSLKTFLVWKPFQQTIELLRCVKKNKKKQFAFSKC